MRPRWRGKPADAKLPAKREETIMLITARILLTLAALGFSAITVSVDEVLKFAARKPAAEADDAADAAGAT